MTRLAKLPQIMLAPKGARRIKADHPALPLTIPDRRPARDNTDRLRDLASRLAKHDGPH